MKQVAELSYQYESFSLYFFQIFVISMELVIYIYLKSIEINLYVMQIQSKLCCDHNDIIEVTLKHFAFPCLPGFAKHKPI